MKIKHFIIACLMLIFGTLFAAIYYKVKGINTESFISSIEISHATLMTEKILYDPSFGIFDTDMDLNPTIYFENGEQIQYVNSVDLFLINRDGNYIYNTANPNTITIVPFALQSGANLVNAISFLYFIINDINNNSTNKQAIKAIDQTPDFFSKYTFDICQVYFNDPATISYQPSSSTLIDINNLSDRFIFQYIDLQNKTVSPSIAPLIQLILSLPPKDYNNILTILKSMSSPNYAGYPAKSPISQVRSYSAQMTQLAILNNTPPPLPTAAPISAPVVNPTVINIPVCTTTPYADVQYPVDTQVTLPNNVIQSLANAKTTPPPTTPSGIIPSNTISTTMSSKPASV